MMVEEGGWKNERKSTVSSLSSVKQEEYCVMKRIFIKFTSHREYFKHAFSEQNIKKKTVLTHHVSE